MRADLYRHDAPDQVIGTARWREGTAPAVEASDDDARERLARIFRPTAVVVDDQAYRSFGTAGPVVLQPGSLRWFQAAARTRALREGLGVRFVDEEEAMGWDPAGAYRTFSDAMERKVTISGPATGF